MSKKWLKAAGIRAVKTVAQTAAALIVTAGASATLGDINWMTVLSTSAVAGILSLLTSVKGLPEVEA